MWVCQGVTKRFFVCIANRRTRKRRANVRVEELSVLAALIPAGAAAEYAVRPGERQAGDQGGFQGQGAHVLRLQVMDVRLAAGACQRLDLAGHGAEEVRDALRARVDVEALH